MGSSRKLKSTRAKGARPHQRRPRSGIPRKAASRSLAEIPEIPPVVENEIENQRDVLVTVITLLHCVHVVLHHQESGDDEDLSPSLRAAAGWASLPQMTAMILERVHNVLTSLDTVMLKIKASEAFKP
jgi:hypothetical protein